MLGLLPLAVRLVPARDERGRWEGRERTYDRYGLFAVLLETMRPAMAGSATFSSLSPALVGPWGGAPVGLIKLNNQDMSYRGFPKAKDCSRWTLTAAIAWRE